MLIRRLAPLALAVVFFALAGSAQASGQLMAGAASIDANWHVGASAGQYASTADPSSGEFDPYNHSIKNKPSYGTQSRMQVRAIVFQEAGGKKVAMAKTDMYIPQDLLWRRAAQILASRHIGIDKSNLTMTITHDHSSPYYSSTAPGVWTFQDVFDIRFFNYYAHRIADAVTLANSRMKPARMGASVMKYDKPQRNALGPTVADDGTPAGFPNSYTDHEMIVLRFDEAAGGHRPIATFIDYELHGEGLSGNDLISADFIGPLQRMVDRRTGGVAYYAQNAVGTTEPERSPDYHNVHERLDFPHREYGQNEYEAAGIAKAVLHLWGDIGRGRPEKGNESRFVPFTTHGPVTEHDQFFPGPPSHPYPTVSSCRTDQAFKGDPRIPVVGLPDCEQFSGAPHAGADVIGVPFDYNIPTVDPGITENDLKSRGVPVPDNISAPSSGALEENIGIHLQAFRLGPVSFTVCSCEQWADQSLNIKTRTNSVPGDEYLGYDWSKLCRKQGDGSYKADGSGTGHWICPNPQVYSDDPPQDKTLPPLSDKLIEHMRAQVLNPANGWDAPANVTAESEPTDLTKIKGNYTHDDTTKFAPKLTVPISMANDYNGYIATYREFQRGDHYRKALTGWGPHSSDYMATRLVRMVRELNGGPPLPTEVLQPKEIADNASSDQRAQALGNAESAEKGYEASLPDDGGKPGPLTQPKNIERFSAATFSWLGGSNFTDNPTVRVERRAGHRWVPFADQSGEVPVTVKFPQYTDAAPFAAGNQKWKWTASFEAFVSRYDLVGGARATPAGTYRFVADGAIRHGKRPVSYRVLSRSFSVSPWRGLRVQHLRRGDGGSVLFSVGPGRTISIPKDDKHPAARAAIGPIDYPDSYSNSPTRFIKNERSFIRDPAAPNDPKRFEWYCVTCSFRPWADSGSARSATVTVVSRSRRVRHVRAVRRGTGFIARGALRCGEKAYVGAGATRDPFGNLNGVSSATIGAGSLVDRVSPRSRLRLKTLRASRTRVSINGISNDTGGCHAGVRRVQIELVKKNPLKNKLCRYVLKSGRLSRERSCDRPLFLAARGTNQWRFALKVNLPRGYYRIRARAVDRVGNREHPRSPARTRFLLR
jgi:hypothetical protein